MCDFDSIARLVCGRGCGETVPPKGCQPLWLSSRLPLHARAVTITERDSVVSLRQVLLCLQFLLRQGGTYCKLNVVTRCDCRSLNITFPCVPSFRTKPPAVPSASYSRPPGRTPEHLRATVYLAQALQTPSIASRKQPSSRQHGLHALLHRLLRPRRRHLYVHTPVTPSHLSPIMKLHTNTPSPLPNPHPLAPSPPTPHTGTAVPTPPHLVPRRH